MLDLGKIHDGQTLQISPKDRRNHVHVVGASNKGKSKFMENMIRQDLLNPNVGGCVIDPHGLLVDDILLWASHLAPHVAKRIVLFEPASDSDLIAGFNPIPKSYDSLSATVYGIIDSILYAWGQGGEVFPRLRPQLYNVLYPVLANGLTLVEALAMFSLHHKAERDVLLDNIGAGNVRAAWDSLRHVSNTEEWRMLEGVINRFSALLNSEYMRRILSVQESSIDLGQIMADKKILLVSLRSHDRIHSDNLRMLGTMILTEIYRVGMLRNEHDQPPPFHVYIDEFGQYTTPVVGKALDEIRKKSVYLTVAHQHIAQLISDEMGSQLLSSIMTNCRLKVAFGGLTPHDADLITRLMWTPHIDLKEIKHQQFATKVRTVEETRTSYTNGASVADSLSHTQSQSANWSDGKSKGQSQTQTLSNSESVSETNTTGKTSSTNWSEGTTQSHTAGSSLGKTSSKAKGTSTNHSNTQGTSYSKSQAETNSSSHSSSSSESGGSSSSNSTSRSGGHNITYIPDGQFTTRGVHSHSDGFTSASTNSSSYSYSHSNSQSSSHSRTESTSHTDSESYTVGGSESSTITKGLNHTASYSDTTGGSSNHGGAIGKSQSSSLGKTQGTARSDAQGQSETETSSHGGSKGQSLGQSRTNTHNQSTTVGPYDRKIEYQEEINRTFYSLPEQFHRKTGEMMALPQGQALVQFDGQHPVILQTTRLDDVPMLKYGRTRKLDSCKQRMIEANNQYYATITTIEQAAYERQIEKFRRPLSFDDTPLEEWEPILELDHEDDPFNTQ